MIGCRLNRSHTASGLAVGPPSSVDVIAPMRCSDAPSVQPVLKACLLQAWHRLWTIVHRLHRCLWVDHRLNRCYWVFLTWLSKHIQLHRWPSVGSSDNHRLDRGLCVGLTGAAYSASFCPIRRSNHLDTSKKINMLLHLYDWLDLSSWQWIGHCISTMDWT